MKPYATFFSVHAVCQHTKTKLDTPKFATDAEQKYEQISP
jgi:hypothetical protein